MSRNSGLKSWGDAQVSFLGRNMSHSDSSAAAELIQHAIDGEETALAALFSG
jgi:hypothetical protein